MGLYKKILAPVDGSTNSFVALKHAAELARSFDAEICIIYVSLLPQTLPVISHIESYYIPEYSFSDVENFAKKIIEAAREAVPEGIRVQTHTEIGSPNLIITEYAEKNNFDIIVIGSRGLGIFSELLMGSVSSYVVHHAKCPVLVVK